LHTGALPPEVLKQVQDGCTATLDRAIRPLVSSLGENHPFVRDLKNMVGRELPESADAFEKERWHDG